jgi:hypothetical protein
MGAAAPRSASLDCHTPFKSYGSFLTANQSRIETGHGQCESLFDSHSKAMMNVASDSEALRWATCHYCHK